MARARSDRSDREQSTDRMQLTLSRARAREVSEEGMEAGWELSDAAEDVVDAESNHTWRSRWEKWRAVTMEALRSIASTDDWRDEFDRATRHVFRQVGQSEGQTLA